MDFVNLFNFFCKIYIIHIIIIIILVRSIRLLLYRNTFHKHTHTQNQSCIDKCMYSFIITKSLNDNFVSL